MSVATRLCPVLCLTRGMFHVAAVEMFCVYPGLSFGMRIAVIFCLFDVMRYAVYFYLYFLPVSCALLGL